MMSKNLVTVRDLHKVFQRGGERIDVLQGVTLDIPEGDFLGDMCREYVEYDIVKFRAAGPK